MPIKHARTILWEMISRPKRADLDEHKIQFLQHVPIFAELSDRQIEKVFQHLHERQFNDGEYLFEINQPGAALFMIAEGEVAVEMPLDKGQVGQLALLKAGAFIGELALLDDSPRSASARATKYTKVFAFFRNDLKKLMATNPEVAAQIYRALATVVGDRLKTTNDLLSEIQNAHFNRTAS